MSGDSRSLARSDPSGQDLRVAGGLAAVAALIPVLFVFVQAAGYWFVEVPSSIRPGSICLSYSSPYRW